MAIQAILRSVLFLILLFQKFDFVGVSSPGPTLNEVTPFIGSKTRYTPAPADQTFEQYMTGDQWEPIQLILLQRHGF